MRILFIRYFTSLIWRIFPKKFALAMQRFSHVEADSGWQALQIAQCSDDPKIKALFLKMAFEEARHALLFRSAALEINSELIYSWELPARDSLIEDASCLAAAIAEISLNEQAIFREFSVYREACPNVRVKKIFDQIAEDEESHGEDTELLIQKLINDDSVNSKKYFIQAYRGRIFRNVSATSKAIGNTIFSILLAIIYFSVGLVVAPFAYFFARRV